MLSKVTQSISRMFAGGDSPTNDNNTEEERPVVNEAKKRKVSVAYGKDLNVKKLVDGLAYSHDQAKSMKDKKLVLLLGDTGVGKSTFCCALISRQVQFRYSGVHVQPSVPAGTSSADFPKVGMTGSSETLFCQAYEIDGFPMLYVCDCPGSFDNRPIEECITSKISFKQTILESQGIAAIVVMFNANEFFTKGAGIQTNLAIVSNVLRDFDDEAFKSVIFLFNRLHHHAGLIHCTPEEKKEFLMQEILKQQKVYERDSEICRLLKVMMDNQDNVVIMNEENVQETRRAVLDKIDVQNLIDKSQFQFEFKNDEKYRRAVKSLQEHTIQLKDEGEAYNDHFKKVLMVKYEKEEVEKEISNLESSLQKDTVDFSRRKKAYETALKALTKDKEKEMATYQSRMEEIDGEISLLKSELNLLDTSEKVVVGHLSYRDWNYLLRMISVNYDLRFDTFSENPVEAVEHFQNGVFKPKEKHNPSKGVYHKNYSITWSQKADFDVELRQQKRHVLENSMRIQEILKKLIPKKLNEKEGYEQLFNSAKAARDAYVQKMTSDIKTVEELEQAIKANETRLRETIEKRNDLVEKLKNLLRERIVAFWLKKKNERLELFNQMELVITYFGPDFNFTSRNAFKGDFIATLTYLRTVDFESLRREVFGDGIVQEILELPSETVFLSETVKSTKNDHTQEEELMNVDVQNLDRKGLVSFLEKCKLEVTDDERNRLIDYVREQEFDGFGFLKIGMEELSEAGIKKGPGFRIMSFIEGFHVKCEKEL
ncbi:hypothetical protein C9374_000725 [Naegleria lovaniensis]|uniref:Uncharacterized protein n=1 Tax=Naegleria lovaniensis TaxID=51637 RepID=A0AA88GUB6_NAELO|nr:uncharacterized protein C9374_000725 [Naegleria lovaniensis]KAG2388561.1 hypothetical protein C9374_000725 [Naegleria lovaniensis]